MKKLLFLYNPHAGKGRAKSRLPMFLEVFTQAGWLVTARPTQGKDDATQVAAQLGGSFDRVVCCGGDGTLHETVCGLMALKERPQVGYIPAGTTNDFSRNLRLPRGFEKLARTAANGLPRPVDIGRFNDRFFVYVAAFGAFTDVSYDTPQPFKNMFGHLAYVLEGVARLGSIQSYRLVVEYNGERLEGDFIFGMISNTVSVGGFQGIPASQVDLGDGQFEMVLVRQPESAAQLQSILRALVQTATDSDGMVVAMHASHIKVRSAQELPWTLDGEYGGAPQVAEVVNCTHALDVVYGA